MGTIDDEDFSAAIIARLVPGLADRSPVVRGTVADDVSYSFCFSPFSSDSRANISVLESRHQDCAVESITVGHTSAMCPPPVLRLGHHCEVGATASLKNTCFRAARLWAVKCLNAIVEAADALDDDHDDIVVDEGQVGYRSG